MTVQMIPVILRKSTPILPRVPVNVIAICVAVFCCGCVPLLSAAGPSPSQPQRSQSAITLRDALKATLERHPALQVQRWEIEKARGTKQQSSGAFDTLIESSLTHQNQRTPVSQLQSQQTNGSAGSIIPTSDTAYNLSASRLFRNGINVMSFTRIDRTSNELLGPLPFNTSQVGVEAVVPLFRGRGRRAVAANELAGEVELASTELDLEQTKEQLLANTAVAYWNLLAAKRQLEVAAGSEQRGRLLLETVKALIDADQVPRSDIYQVNANVADRVANRISFEQAVVQAREQLGLNMGLSPDDILRVGDPADDFPPLDEAVAADAAQDPTSYYVQEAMNNRPDLKAAQKREAEARVLALSARNGTQPELNLRFATGYTQLRENDSTASFFQSLFTSGHRPDVSAGVVYQFPQSNNAAKGQLLQAQSKWQQTQLQTADLQRQVTAAVAMATYNVRSSVLRVKSTQQAVEAFQKALEGEREKFRLGQASLTEVLTIEDRLTTALASSVGAEQAYALALTALRLATGTLLPATGTDTVDPGLLQTLPSIQQGRAPRSRTGR